MCIKISIIIPIYNGSKTLSRCIDSIIHAQIPGFQNEIILINDGSIDSSAQICEEYNSLYSNIRFFSQENKGVSAARNLGIIKARGEWISFLDCDDTITDSYFKTLKDYLDKDFEVIEFAYNRLEKNTKSLRLPYYKTLNRQEIILHIEKSTSNFLLYTVRRIYRKKFLINNDIKYEEGLLFEDPIFSLNVFKNLNSLLVIPKALYNYHQNPNSITQQKYIENILDVFEKHFYLRKEIKIEGINYDRWFKNEAKQRIDKTFFYILNNVLNSPHSKLSELKQARNSIIFIDSFEKYKYNWKKNFKKNLIIKLFEWRCYRFLLLLFKL